jgi:feruloyl esterase
MSVLIERSLMRIVLGVMVTAFLTPASGLAADFKPVNPVASCASLKSAQVDSMVGERVKIDGAAERVINGHRYCDLRGTIAAKIGFEVRLPASAWTQRYLQVGCGGLCGVLDIRVEHADDCVPLQDHAAALASTDMGHRGRTMGDGAFGADPQARIDFAYRGVHLTALAAKALLKVYYGQAPKRAYFSGCSDGGREALMEAERFPQDFDGIAAGAPAMNFQVQNTFYHAWMYTVNHRADGSAILTAAQLPALHEAALAACDQVDGLKDGQITDPRACRFDPALAVCKAGQPQDQCLTTEQAEVARKFYAGPSDAAGHRFTVGGPQVGSELAWRGVFVPDDAQGRVMSEDAALGTLRFLAFPTNPAASYSLSDFDFDQATFRRLDALHPLYDATDTDLSAFVARGGKLLLWHGWSDPHISPINTIAFYRAAEASLGKKAAEDALRLFLFPGMYHCFGGDGTGSFDVLSPLMKWVEEGTGPDRIIAAKVDLPPMGPPPSGAARASVPVLQVAPPIRTRPVYAYPRVATYSGTGSIDQAGNFRAGDPLFGEPDRYLWEGENYLAPGFHKTCEVSAGQLACH